MRLSCSAFDKWSQLHISRDVAEVTLTVDGSQSPGLRISSCRSPECVPVDDNSPRVQKATELRSSRSCPANGANLSCQPLVDSTETENTAIKPKDGGHSHVLSGVSKSDSVQGTCTGFSEPQRCWHSEEPARAIQPRTRTA